MDTVNRALKHGPPAMSARALSPELRSLLLRYGFAVSGIAAAALLRVILAPVLQHEFPFATFYVAVTFVAWYGGLGPALLAIGMGYLVEAYFFLQPVHSLSLARPADEISFATYCFVGLSIALLSEAQRHANRRAEAVAKEVAKREAELAVANRRIARMLESMGDSFVVIDSDWRYVELNERAAEMTGRSREELAGKTVWELYPESVDTPYYRVLHRAMSEQRPIAFEWFYAPAGRWLETRAYPSADGLAVHSADITERRRLEDARARLAAIVESSEDAIISTDLEGRVLTWNPGAERLYGYRAEEALGQDVGFVMPSDRRHELPSILARIRNGESVHAYDAVRVRKGGHRVDVSVTVSPIRDRLGVVFGASNIARDITERRRSEHTLRHHQQEIEGLNTRLRQAMKETHHRVKNNLQVIAALVDMQVMNDQPTVPTTELVRLGKHIKMLAAVHDLLTQEARTDADVNYVSSRAAIEKLMPLMNAIVGDRHVECRVSDVHLPVRHSTALAILINELVSNAVKHGSGDIELGLRIEGATAVLEVLDDGPGFPQEFDPRRAANTGLDLIESVSRWDLQGETRYENRDTGGARVVVTFPVPAAEPG